jgi:hypothetical protein
VANSPQSKASRVLSSTMLNRGVKSDRIVEQKMALCFYIPLRVQVNSYAVLSAM